MEPPFLLSLINQVLAEAIETIQAIHAIRAIPIQETYANPATQAIQDCRAALAVASLTNTFPKPVLYLAGS